MRITKRQLRRIVGIAIVCESSRRFVELAYQERRALHEVITAQDILDDIAEKIFILKAKEVGGETWKFVKDQVKGKAVDIALTIGSAVPFLGAKIAAIKLSKDLMQIGVDAAMKAPEIVKAAQDITMVAAGEYAGMDDDQVGKNPLAKVFNIDDRMELPLKNDYVKDFSSKMAKYMIDNPDVRFDSKNAGKC